MTIIPITTDGTLAGEHKAIILLFEKCGVEWLHVRKPSFSLNEIRQWITSLPSEYHPRLRLHDHFELAGEFTIGGLHLNARNPLPPVSYSGKLSASCHSLQQAKERLQAAAPPAPQATDVFLSPIFDSISKVGYKSNFPQHELIEQMSNMPPACKTRIIALGGITPQNIKQIQYLGFGGAAVIGSLWKRYCESKNIEHLLEDYTALKKAANAAELNNNPQAQITISTHQSAPTLPKVMFITHATEKYNYIQSAEIALQGGIRWIQYRHKPPVTELQQQTEISAITALCKQYGALLTINDHPSLAINSHGLHVGLQDITVAEARLLFGRDKIIGGTANTFDHIKTHAEQHANYVGVGPFRYTETKKNLSPVLGLDGYANLVKQCSNENINIPIYAIGGIRTEDIEPLMATGIYGIAISSLILQAKDPVETSKTIVGLTRNLPLRT
ncbi:MAG: thiamine phosphate synthase [Bacteroidales bacterium]|jgi:thiamine-phosphate pyrophosphorylase|nr:thiamine phosphate synthase [Bacteroidales bacterium]